MEAVVKMGGSQYLVSVGQKLLVDVPVVDQILLVIDGDKTIVGQPNVEKAKVIIEDLGEARGEKVRVFKFTAKSRSRKTVGFRATYHEVLVKDIKL